DREPLESEGCHMRKGGSAALPPGHRASGTACAPAFTPVPPRARSEAPGRGFQVSGRIEPNRLGGLDLDVASTLHAGSHEHPASSQPGREACDPGTRPGEVVPGAARAAR